jgi:hypothetical protein
MIISQCIFIFQDKGIREERKQRYCIYAKYLYFLPSPMDIPHTHTYTHTNISWQNKENARNNYSHHFCDWSLVMGGIYSYFLFHSFCVPFTFNKHFNWLWFFTSHG